MSNKAKEIIVPDEGVFRIVSLYVGQGESTLLVIPDGSNFRYLLIDTNNDIKNGGIDITSLLEDLLDDGLDVFINTHPHNDHLKGIKKIHETTNIKEIWHSGHKPGKDHNDSYEELREIIKDIGTENEYVLFGTNDLNTVRKSDKDTKVEKKLGNIDYQVFSPAEYVSDDIEKEKPEERYNRIHEQCAVMKFSYGEKDKRHFIITGDADKKAWQEHITDYYKDELPSDVLSAVHHGSRTFFKDSEDDEDVYENHIKAIEPDYLILSAPKQSESPHGHPHDDALDLYKEYVVDDNIYHLGKNRECVLVDINKAGKLDIKFDQELVEEYGNKTDGSSGSSGGSKVTKSFAIGSQTSRIDRKPMG